MTDIIFEVVGRRRIERLNKGNYETIYQVSLKSNDGFHRLVLTDTNSAIIQNYPFGSMVNVSIGPNPQTNLPMESKTQ